MANPRHDDDDHKDRCRWRATCSREATHMRPRLDHAAGIIIRHDVACCDFHRGLVDERDEDSLGLRVHSDRDGCGGHQRAVAWAARRQGVRVDLVSLAEIMREIYPNGEPHVLDRTIITGMSRGNCALRHRPDKCPPRYETYATRPWELRVRRWHMEQRNKDRRQWSAFFLLLDDAGREPGDHLRRARQ